MRALLATPVDPDDYRRALLRLLGFHRWVAARLAESASDPETAAAVPAAFLSGDRVDDLVADLGSLGAPVPPGLADTGNAPSRGAPGLAEALGILYVSEGSRLGGAVIGRHLAATLGLDRDRGLRFFLGAPGEDVPRRWRDLCGLLTANGGRGTQFTERVAGSAQGCFRAAHRFLALEAP